MADETQSGSPAPSPQAAPPAPPVPPAPQSPSPTPSSANQSNPSEPNTAAVMLDAAGQEYLTSIMEDIGVMLTYARKNGIAIPDNMAPQIADLYGDPDGDAAKGPLATVKTLQKALSLLNTLSSHMAPICPASVRASSLTKNPTLLILCAAGAVCLVSAMASGLYFHYQGQNAAVFQLHLLTVAGLGAAFFALNSARTYLRAGSFNPRYNQVYMVRFAFGVLAGYILAQVEPSTFGLAGNPLPPTGAPPGAPPPPPGHAVSNEFPPFFRVMLAFLGGFAADGVAAFLQRLADTLLTAVKGNDADQVKAKADNQVQKALNSANARLTETVDSIAPTDDPATIQKKLRDVLRETSNSG